MATNDDDDDGDGDGKKASKRARQWNQMKWKVKRNGEKTNENLFIDITQKFNLRTCNPFTFQFNRLLWRPAHSPYHTFSLPLIAMENYCERDAHIQQSDTVARMKINELNGQGKKREKKSIAFIKIKVISTLFRCRCCQLWQCLFNPIQFKKFNSIRQLIKRNAATFFGCLIEIMKRGEKVKERERKEFQPRPITMKVFLMISFSRARLSLI